MKHARVMAAVMMAAGLVLAAAGAPAGENEAKAPAKADRQRHVDLVICLDTSGSMSGLIASAKKKLWAVVNELATAKPKPVLRVGLYHYGNDGLNKEDGWVKQLSPLTDDLDGVYGKLFALRTNGGTELVARVIRAATNELDWNRDKGTLRMIFVAGNEPATQDKTHDLQAMCKAAATKGIIVNTIHCGGEALGRRTGWADAARWADGQYAAIDQNRGTVVINTPYDKRLSTLSAELNATYVTYGARGRARQANQVMQDKNAASLSPSASAGRAVSKGSGLYRNASWDLVDAVKEEKVDLAKVKKADLPEEMQGMTAAQRKAHVAKMAARRAEIQKEIRKLGEQRSAHIKKEMARKGLDESSSFDAALRSAVRTQAQKKNFKFK